MKLLLQILWGWSVLANGAVGIQVGTVQTNNQNIKLMKMNFTSPIWLQSASNVGGGGNFDGIVFSCYDNNDAVFICSGNGDITVKSKKDGNKIIQHLLSPENQEVTVSTDSNTDVIVIGDLSAFSNLLYYPRVRTINHMDLSRCDGLIELVVTDNRELKSLDLSNNTQLTVLDVSSTGIVSIDLSNNTQLTALDVSSTGITSLDLSSNTQLTSLDISNMGSLSFLNIANCTELSSIERNGSLYTNFSNVSAIAIKEEVVSAIVSMIETSNVVDGVVTLRQGDEFNQTIIDAALEKGWDVQYYQ